MNILITGANGFIGKQLDEYLSQWHLMYSLVRLDPGIPKPRIILLDLSNEESIKEGLVAKIFPEKIDVILHCAAQLADSENYQDMSVFHANNRITTNVIALASFLKPQKLINFSTIGVYPNTDGTYTELSYVHPSANRECLYSLSKFCSEELFTHFLSPQMDVINLRLSQTLGEGMRKDRIYSIMLTELLEHNTIILFGNGLRHSSFITIDYLKSTVKKMLSRPDINGVYNLGEKNMSYRELAEEIIKKHGNKDSRILYKEEGIRSKVIIDSSKLHEKINGDNE